MIFPSFATVDRPLTDNPSLYAVSCRDQQAHAINLLQRSVDIKDINTVVEVGGSVGANIKESFNGAQYYNLDVVDGSAALPTIVCDITKKIPLTNNSIDFIYSNNCLEHLCTPWTAALEIVRILRPGGHLYVSAPWSWRYHPVPIDFWRFSPDALESLFKGISCAEKGFNIGFRRDDLRGFWPNNMDAVPADSFGGWRENWLSYFFGTKVT